MQAGVVTAQIQPGKMDEVVSIIQDSVRPTTEQQKGFKGGLFLVDRTTGKAIIIGLWETEADRTAYQASGLQQENLAKVVPSLAGPPTIEWYEVAMQA